MVCINSGMTSLPVLPHMLTFEKRIMTLIFVRNKAIQHPIVTCYTYCNTMKPINT